MARKSSGATFHVRDAKGSVARIIVFRDDGYIVRKSMEGGRWIAEGGVRQSRQRREEILAVYTKWRDDTAAGVPCVQRDGTTRPRAENEGCFDGEPPRGTPWRTVNAQKLHLRMARIMRDGYEDLRCGCRVEPDGKCHHGHSSTLRVYGMV